MLRRKVHTVREFTDDDLGLLALADRLERAGEHLDLVELIRTEVDRGPTTTADYLRMRRVVRHRRYEDSPRGRAYEAWAVGMLTHRFNGQSRVW